MADSSPKVLTVRMLDASDEGIPVEIEFMSKTIQKKIPPGMGLRRFSLIFSPKMELQDAELVIERL